MLQGRSCFPPAITPAVGRPVRCTVTLPGDTGSVGDVAPHRQQASSRIWRVATSPTRVLQAPITQRCTRYVAIHPIRRNTPDQKGCNAYGSGATPPPTTSPTADTPSRHTTTGSIGRRHTTSTHSHRFRARAVAPVTSRYTRSVAVHPIRRGAVPTDRVRRLPQQAQPRAIPPHRPQPAASNAATRPRHAHPGSEREALHQLASITLPPSWCNTQLSGVTPLSNKYQCGDMPRLSSQNTRQRSSAATEETVHHRETGTGSNTIPQHFCLKLN